MFADYKQMEFIDPLLKLILSVVEDEFGQKVFTSLFRINDPGPHGTLPLRASDLRERNHVVGNTIKGWINSKWIYDPVRPGLRVCIFHDTGHGLHLHIQVHENTIVRRV